MRARAPASAWSCRCRTRGPISAGSAPSRGLRESRRGADRPVTAIVIDGIQPAFVEIAGVERAADQDDRGAFELAADGCFERPERGADDALVGPARAPDDRDRTIGAVVRRKLGD